ncbi:hypothetical protein ACHAXR_011947 [Thalassiosira sp. AJA248-18]
MSSHATLAVGAVAGAIASTALQRHRSSSFSRKSSSDLPPLSSSANKNKTMGTSSSSSSSTPQQQQRGNGKNVGILALEVYTPRTYISQSKLEEHSGVSPPSA